MWHYRPALAQRCTIEPVRRSPQKLAGLITNQNRAISILPFRRQTSLNVSYPSSIVDFGIEDISSFLAFFGFAASVVAAYLKLNKLWSRRHSEEVTQSISVSAFALDLLIYACYGFSFYLLGIMQGLLASILWIGYAGMIVLMGSGLWLRGGRQKGLWVRIRNPLQLEKTITTLLETSKRLEIAGGYGFLVDAFYSREYAMMIRDQYRKLGFFHSRF